MDIPVTYGWLLGQAESPYWSQGIRTDVRKAPRGSVTRVSVLISVGWSLSVSIHG